MQTCNDPKCPLNRQGVPHPIHELIENQPVTNPCLDGRCAMNRMGMPHNSHDDLLKKTKNAKSLSGNKQTVNEEYEPESFNDALGQLGKNIKKDYPSSFEYEPRPHTQTEEYKINELSQEQDEAELLRRQRLRREHEEAEKNQLKKDQEEEIERLKNIEEDELLKRTINAKSLSGNKQVINEEYEPESFDDALGQLGKNIKKDYPGAFKHKPISPPYQPPRENIKQKQIPIQKEISEIERILSKKEPYEVFGLSKGVSFNEIKKLYKALALKYNPNVGRANRTVPENKRADEIMKKINLAYTDLERLHGL